MKYAPGSSIELPPTPGHCRRIAKQCAALGEKRPLEETVSNRREARNLMYELRGKLKMKGGKK